MLTVAIIGDKGFVGQETTQLFQERGLQVLGYDLMTNQDITDIQQLEEFIKFTHPHRILHLAAVARFSDADDDPKRAMEVNGFGTNNVAVIARKYHIPLVFASTGSVYMPIDKEMPITEKFPIRGNSNYAAGKVYGERCIKWQNNPWIILRYSHLYGANKKFHGAIGGFVDRIEHGVKPGIMGGEQTNDFCYVKDIAEANYLAVTAGYDKYFQEYNIGTGREISTKEVAKQICEMMGWKKGLEQLPVREVDAKRFVYDITKAKMMLEFEAKWTFEKGLKDLLQIRGLVKK